MSTNIIRKIVQKIGLDLHKYYPETNKLNLIKTLGISTVIDVGANIGQFAEEIREILPEAKIYSFEPVKDCFDSLLTNMSADKNFKAFNVALGELDAESIIQKNEYRPSSSILEMDDLHKNLFPQTKITTEEKIAIKKLDTFEEFTANEIKKEILLKIDTQGYEDKVLKGAQNFLKDVKALLLETSYVELYKGQPLFKDIYTQVTSLGFSYKGAMKQKINKQNGEVLFEDSLFIRP